MTTQDHRGTVSPDRRRFLNYAAMAAAPWALNPAALAQAGDNARTVPPVRPETNSSFGSLKQVKAGVLNVGYAGAGPPDGPAVVLLHGLPTISTASSTWHHCSRPRAIA